MHIKPTVLTIALTSITIGSTTGAQAQNLQNWLTNEANRIQQGVASGALSPAQAAAMQNREAQIQSQQQQYLTQNGGILASWQQNRLKNELRHLNGRMGNSFNQGFTSYGYPYGYNGGPSFLSRLFGSNYSYPGYNNYYGYQGSAYGFPGSNVSNYTNGWLGSGAPWTQWPNANGIYHSRFNCHGHHHMPFG